MSTNRNFLTPAWSNESTEIVIHHADGSTETEVVSSQQAASVIEEVIARRVRLGDATLRSITIELDSRS
jgi:hypothetical protein